MGRWVWLLVVTLCSVCLAQGKEPKEKRVEGDPKVTPGVNWQGQVIRATGAGAPDVKSLSPAQARLGAETAAKLDALRNLLAQVRRVPISAGRAVDDAMQTDALKARVEGLIRGYKVVGKRYFSDGGVELDIEVPLAMLTDVFDPDAVQQLAVESDRAQTNTGLVIDARGLDLKPALNPRVLDASGNSVYSVDSLSPQARKASGVAAWVQGLEEAKKSLKAGEKPLILKAQKAQGSDLHLGAEEAKLLASVNASFLAEGRVVIVLN